MKRKKRPQCTCPDIDKGTEHCNNRQQHDEKYFQDHKRELMKAHAEVKRHEKNA